MPLDRTQRGSIAGHEGSLVSDPSAFEEHRSYLIGLAYRMVGTLSEAEDIVQDAYLRWHRTDQETIEDPRAWLTTTTSRLCLDHLKSARRQREIYIGPWLPEPLVTDTSSSPLGVIETAEHISMAFLTTLEKLTPEERATFLLHDVFDYSFDEIANILGKTTVSCRKSASRARSHLKDGKPRFAADTEEHLATAQKFQELLLEADLSGLIQLFKDDIEVWTDGGGKAMAALNIVRGGDKAARFFLGLARKSPSISNLELRMINGLPGFIAYEDDRLSFVASIHVTDARIQAVHVVRNPDKFGGVQPLH